MEKWNHRINSRRGLVSRVFNRNGIKRSEEEQTANSNFQSPMLPMKMTVKIKKNRLLTFFLLIACIFLFFGFFIHKNNKYTQKFTSNLVAAIEIDELSTSEIVFNGIATIKHPNSDNPHYFIRYDSTIKVGVNLKDVHFEVDSSDKTVKIYLPDVFIQEVVINPGSVGFIPDNFNTDLRTAIVNSKNDALEKAAQLPKLIQTAEDNLKTIIEALTLPLVQPEGYTIVWQNSTKI